MALLETLRKSGFFLLPRPTLERHAWLWPVLLASLPAGLLIAGTSSAVAVDVSTQSELDTAVSAQSNPINIVAGNLALSGGQTIAPATDLTVATGASLSVSNANQTIGSLSGGGTVTAGTTLLIAGGNNASTAFSGTIDLSNQSYSTGAFGQFAKVGSGTLTIDNANIALGETYIAQGAMAQTSGTTTVTDLAVGEGTAGTLNVSGGTITFGTGLQVGDFGGQGTVNQTGGAVVVMPTCGDVSHCASLTVGNQGGSGIYNMSGGELDLTGLVNSLGRSSGTGHSGSTGTLNISGGVVDLSGGAKLIIGYGNEIAAQPQSQGTIVQTGGILRVHNDSFLFLSGQFTSTGVYDLNGGTLEIGGASLLAGYNNSGLHYQFNLGGGTIRVIESSLVTNVNATLTTGMSTIDTNGFGATWGGVMSGAGGLVKAGLGTLSLTAANSYMGGTTIAGGVLQIGNGGTGGSIAGDVVDNGTLAFDRSNAVAFGGAISGTGGLTKAGAGVLTLSGPGSYTGATSVGAGALQAGAANVFSQGSAFTVASGATLDLASFNNGIGSLAGGGNVTLGSAILTSGNDGTSTTFSGAIGGSGGLTKTGAGVWSLTGTSTYLGPTNVNAGVLDVNGGAGFDGVRQCRRQLDGRRHHRRPHRREWRERRAGEFHRDVARRRQCRIRRGLALPGRGERSRPVGPDCRERSCDAVGRQCAAVRHIGGQSDLYDPDGAGRRQRHVFRGVAPRFCVPQPATGLYADLGAAEPAADAFVCERGRDAEPGPCRRRARRASAEQSPVSGGHHADLGHGRAAGLQRALGRDSCEHADGHAR